MVAQEQHSRLGSKCQQRAVGLPESQRAAGESRRRRGACAAFQQQVRVRLDIRYSAAAGRAALRGDAETCSSHVPS